MRSERLKMKLILIARPGYPWPYKSGWKINPPITFASLFDESFQISPTQCQNIKLINNFIARP